jgi:hypothetical protein
VKAARQSIAEIPYPAEISLAVKKAFDDGRLCAGEDYLRYLVPVNKEYFHGPSAITDRGFRDEMYELGRFVGDCEDLLGAQRFVNVTDRMFATRIRTLVYCHILEADFSMLTLTNLLRSAKGLDPDWISRRPKKNKIDTLVICQHPRQKIEWLVDLEAGTSGTIGDCLKRLWHNDLRNAFSHSQYFIENDGRLAMSKHFTGAMGHAAGDASKESCHSFSYDEIEARYASAKAFFNAFCKEYKKAIGHYQDGNRQTIGPGQSIRWDRERKVWQTD